MESKDGDQARRSLELLTSTRNATAVEAALPHTPLWYAIAIANAIAGFNLVNRHWGWMVFAIASTAIMMAHHIRKVRVYPRRSTRTVVTNLVAAIVVWALIAAWGVLSATASETPLPLRLAFVAWIPTALVLAAAMALMNRRRERTLAR